jgi:exosortase/archaeosortase
MNQSARWSFNSADVIKIAQVLGWTVVSAIFGFLLALTPLLKVPVQYATIVALIIPFVNTVLYAAYKFASGKAGIPLTPPVGQ